ncbi:MAG: hypothetical protein GWM87_10305 [Xanthomonadales bacterium]|nr:hypothetical protein [Xanthomonadales bacterium]NIX13283.1 hypothetical protein [Xanthomonadales bacterium]
MRFLLVLIVILLVVFFYLREPEPKPIEETFIGPQIESLRKAEGVEADYLDATREQQKRMEEQLEEATGGG